jgi:hypothetical protein
MQKASRRDMLTTRSRARREFGARYGGAEQGGLKACNVVGVRGGTS